MAADILFSNDKLWSSLRSGFEELMQGAKRHCHGDSVLFAVLDDAEVVGCLSLDDPRDAEEKRRLVRCVEKAATEWLDELRGDSGTERKHRAPRTTDRPGATRIAAG